MPPKFIFIRHGQAEHNVGFYTEGVKAFLDSKYKDAPLTELGKKQASETGKKISQDITNSVIDIWSSPLTRCIQTAEEIFEEINCSTLYLSDTLLECLGGGHICNSRKEKKEIKAQFELWNTDFLPDFPPLWIHRENEFSLRSRMLMFCLFLADTYKGYDEDNYLILVSHCDAIRALTGKELKNAEYFCTTLEEILT